MYLRRAKNDALAGRFSILRILFDQYRGDNRTVDGFWDSVVAHGINAALLGAGDRGAVKNFRRNSWVCKIALVSDDLLLRAPTEREVIVIMRPNEMFPITVNGPSVGTALLSAEPVLLDGSVVISLRQEGDELKVTLYKAPKDWTLKAWVKMVRELAVQEVESDLARVDAQAQQLLATH